MKTLYELLKSPTYLFDSHCHLNDKIFNEDREVVVKNANDNDIKTIYDISVNLESAQKVKRNSRVFKNVTPFFGIDPEIFIPGSEMFSSLNTNNDYFSNIYIKLKALVEEYSKDKADSNTLIGIGETGLDFYWTQKLSNEEKMKSHKLQEELFRTQLELASEYNLPLSIHSRNAEEKCIEIIKNYDSRGIFHSYTGGYSTAKKILDAGWGLGVNGIITFKNATELREAYKKIVGLVDSNVTPDFFYKKGIYFETDSPYLAPEGKRGERNEPAYISTIYNNLVDFLKK